MITTISKLGACSITVVDSTVKVCFSPVLSAGEQAVEAGVGLTGGVVSIPLSSIIFSDLRTL